MNRILISILIILSVILFSGSVLAQGQGQQIQQGTQNQGEEGQLTVTLQQQTANQKLEQVKQRIQEKKQIIEEEAEAMEGNEKKVSQNQNQVRVAVQSLLEMEDLTGGIGPQVSEIAREFNNSLQSVNRAELRIANRNAFVRFFMGGDQEAGKELKGEIEANRERIQELYRLRDECDCKEEVRNMFQEQIAQMEEEQNRLDELVQKENQSRGLFGWLFGWLLD